MQYHIHQNIERCANHGSPHAVENGADDDDEFNDSEDSDDEFKELFDVFDQVRVQRTVGINYFGVKKDFFVQEKVR